MQNRRISCNFMIIGGLQVRNLMRDNMAIWFHFHGKSGIIITFICHAVSELNRKNEYISLC